MNSFPPQQPWLWPGLFLFAGGLNNKQPAAMLMRAVLPYSKVSVGRVDPLHTRSLDK